MTIYDANGAVVSTDTADTSNSPKPDLTTAIKSLSGPLSHLCDQIARPRLEMLGIPEYGAMCWAKPSKDGLSLAIHARMRGGFDDAKGKRQEVTEEGHGVIGLDSLGSSDGGALLVQLATELIGMVVARTINRLIDLGANPAILPHRHTNVDGKTCTGCGTVNAMPNPLKWSCPVCGQINAGPLLVQQMEQKP